MTVESLQVKCPKCGTKRSIDGTEERVRCSSNSCDKRFYTKNNIVVPITRDKKDKKDGNGTPQYTTSIINRPSKIQIAIDDVDWLTVLKIMDRGISTIRNKSEVKAKKGAYYFDYMKWMVEFKKIKAIAEVMKLMGLTK